MKLIQHWVKETSTKVLFIRILITAMLSFCASIFSVLLLYKAFSGIVLHVYVILIFILGIAFFLLINWLITYFISYRKEKNAFVIITAIIIYGLSFGLILYFWDFPNLANVEILLFYISTPFLLGFIKSMFGIVVFGSFVTLILRFVNQKKFQNYIFLALTAFAIGILYTITHYQFGTLAQVEDILQIKHLINANHFGNVFTIEQSINIFDFNTIYLYTMSFLASILGIKPAYFLINLFCNIACLLILSLITYKIYGENLLAGVVCNLFFWIMPLQIPGVEHTVILSDQLLPDAISIVFLLLFAYCFFIRKSILLSSLFIGLASVFNFSLGFIYFLIFVGGSLIEDLQNRINGVQLSKNESKLKKYVYIILPYGVISGLILAFAYPNIHWIQSGGEIVKIFASFPIQQFATPADLLFDGIFVGAAFAAATIFFIYSDAIAMDKKINKQRLNNAAVILMVLFLLSFIFIDVFPTRLFYFLAPTKSLVYGISFAAMVMISGFLSELIRLKKLTEFKWAAALVLILFYNIYMLENLAGWVFAIFTLIYFGFLAFEKFALKKWTSYQKYNKNSLLFFSMILFSGYILIQIQPFTGVPLTGYISNAVKENPPSPSSPYTFLLEETQKDAVILSSMNMISDIVSISGRSVFVTPFISNTNDYLLPEWEQRIKYVYGCNDGVVHQESKISKFDENYQKLDDACLTIIDEKYGIDYVVLPLETTTNFPVVFSDGLHKIVTVH